MGFHLAVGIVMALVYADVLEPALPGGDAQKGALYAIAVWLLNAFVVLPATGEGFAGSAHLTLAGITCFAAPHTLFFMVLAMAYGALRRNYRTPLARWPQDDRWVQNDPPRQLHAAPDLPQDRQQVFGSLQIRRVPPLREPLQYRPQKRSGAVASSTPGQQRCQVDCGAQLPGKRSLASAKFQRLRKALFRLVFHRLRHQEKRVALHAQ